MKVICNKKNCSAYPNCGIENDCPFFQGGAVVKDKNIKPIKSQPPRATEDEVQQAVIDYCQIKNIKVAHIANEGKRSAYYGAKMKRMGLSKGFPDLFFPSPQGKYHGLMIELKRDNKSKPTSEQIEWISYLNKQGYCAKVCYGVDEATRQIDEYFKETRE